MGAMDLVAGQLDQQAHEIDVLNQQLQLARSTLEKNGCVCVDFLLCVVPARFPSPRLIPHPSPLLGCPSYIVLYPTPYPPSLLYLNTQYVVGGGGSK
jgi:hypothetical protein